MQNLTGKKYLELSNGRQRLVCLFKSCQFEGIRLKQHVIGKSHKIDEQDANLRETYLTHKINYICSIVKHGLSETTICPDWHTCFDHHLNHVHQIRRDTTEIRK